MKRSICLSKTILVIAFILFQPTSRALAQKSFCAKDWPLQGLDKTKFDGVVSGEGADFTERWTTRTIPYYIDHELPKWMVDKIKLASNILRSKTSINFVRCSAQVAAAAKVDAFIYIGKFEDFCKEGSDAIGCSYGRGMKRKTTPDRVTDEPVGSTIDYTSESSMKKNGAPIGLDYTRRDTKTKKYLVDEYVIIHEFFHRLGFAHQQQNPLGKPIFKSIANRADLANCGIDSRAPWLKDYYDPASITHYGLSSCGGMELDCTLGGLTASGGHRLSQCKVDDVVSDRDPCFYAPKNIIGKDCFLRPDEVKSRNDYSPNDFGLAKCISMLDQALMVSRYVNVAGVEDDKFGLKQLRDKSGNAVCEAN